MCALYGCWEWRDHNIMKFEFHAFNAILYDTKVDYNTVSIVFVPYLSWSSYRTRYIYGLRFRRPSEFHINNSSLFSMILLHLYTITYNNVGRLELYFTTQWWRHECIEPNIWTNIQSSYSAYFLVNVHFLYVVVFHEKLNIILRF